MTFTYGIDGILHVSAQSSGGDFRERLILNPNLHLTEEGKVQAMERIRQIQLAAQGDQRDQLLLERALRLYVQTIGPRREEAAQLIDYWRYLMETGDRIQRRRDYVRVKERLDLLEAAVEEAPLEDGLWFGDPEGFLNLRRAYQAALDYAEGTEKEPSFSLEDAAPRMAEEDAEPTEEGWNLQEMEEDGPNPFEGGEAITKFLELYTGKQRKNPALWMNYVTSDPFLDAAWDSRFISLLLRKVRELLPDFVPNKECMTWLNVAYQFSGKEARSFEGMGDILQIAALGPAPKQPRGNEFAILQSFLDYGL